MLREAIVLAGGFGTRLKGVIEDIPKPMAPVNGRPFLEHLLGYLCSYKIDRIILSTGYLSNVIENHFGDTYKGASIIYSVEAEPLGTGGAIIKALKLCSEENILVVNGDTLFKVDLVDMEQYHILNQADITLALRSVSDSGRYGHISVDSSNRVLIFNEKTGKAQPGEINGGVYMINRKALAQLHFQESFSIEKDLFATHTSQLRIIGMISDAYFIDIGTPEDYIKAEDELY